MAAGVPVPSSPPLIPFPWKQGEHLALIGRTGSGKSTLGAGLVQARQHVISVFTKDDPLADKWPRDTRKITRKVSEIKNDDPRVRRYTFMPRPADQQGEIIEAIRKVWAEGGWTIYFDEAYYLEKELKLTQPITQLLTQGRSKGITVMIGMQRPAWVSRFAVSEPTHVISFSMEGRDAKTIGESTTRDIGPVIERLPRHEAVWYYRPENRYVPYNLDMMIGATRARS